MMKRIKFTSVPVLDQSRALEFYTKKLGLEIFTDQTMGDMCWIELQVPGAETLLVLFKAPGHQPGEMPAVVFVADNVKTTYEELKARGVEFTVPPKKEPWGEHAICKDSRRGASSSLSKRATSPSRGRSSRGRRRDAAHPPCCAASRGVGIPPLRPEAGRRPRGRRPRVFRAAARG